MSDEEIEEVLDKRAQPLSMSMTSEVREQIVRYSQGLPHYTHLIGMNAFQEAAAAKTKQGTDRGTDSDTFWVRRAFPELRPAPAR